MQTNIYDFLDYRSFLRAAIAELRDERKKEKKK